MSEGIETTTVEGRKQAPVQQTYDCLLTRTELALALKVSVRTVDALVSDQEVTPVRLRQVGAVFSAGCDAGVEGESPSERKTVSRGEAQTSKWGVTTRG